MENHNINNFLVHNFYGNYIKNNEDLFTSRLENILTYSLVSKEFYLTNINKNTFLQNTANVTYGFSDDYVCLYDPSYILPRYDNIGIDMKSYLCEPGSCILVNRKWVDDSLEEQEKNFKLGGSNKIITRSMIKPYLSNFSPESIKKDFVLPGEIKIKDKVPINEISGLAFESVILDDNYSMELITHILKKCNKEDIPIYEISPVYKDDMGFHKMDLILKTQKR